MLLLSLVVAVAVSTRAIAICRFVCPDTVGGSPLIDEVLGADGSAPLCEWSGNGLGFRAAGFDSNGNVIPGSETSNNEMTTNAQAFCVNTLQDWTWFNGQVCVTDPVNPRLLTQDTMIPLGAGASPEGCTSACESFGFLYAGIEFGGECHCGNGFSTTVTSVPHTQCNMACTGNSSETCGGPGLMELFAGPNPPRQARPFFGWSIYAPAPCAQDSAARMFTDTFAAGATLARANSPFACTFFCAQNGFTKAGVEGGDECYCGNTFREPPQPLDSSLCNLPCAQSFGSTCGGDFTIQLYTVTPS